jgi:ATP synthase protein I
MDRTTRIHPINHMIKVQVVVLLTIVIFFLLWQGIGSAVASGFGSLIVVASTLLQKWHLLRAAKYARADANLNLREAYLCMAERWALTIVMLGIGFAVLKLAAMPLLSGFIIVQIALLFSNTNRA